MEEFATKLSLTHSYRGKIILENDRTPLFDGK